ncbi:MAG: hypothetical protein RL707_1022 [Pseudomonadota bacterium]|jgi:hypothetical protein
MIPAIRIQNNSITLGKYCIAACPRTLPSGRFAAQVSVASGSGSARTDRVMCFTDHFASHADAANFAISKGLDWVNSVVKTH